MSDDLDFDFGFTAVTEDELEAVQKTKTTAEGAQDKLDKLYNAITPLLTNLKKNPEKEYILWPNRLKKVEELELSVRSANCLKNDNIIYIGDLVQKSESEMLRTPNFGRKSLNEIKEVLQQMELNLGMSVPDWPPENIDDLAKKYEDPFNK